MKQFKVCTVVVVVAIISSGVFNGCKKENVNQNEETSIKQQKSTVIIDDYPFVLQEDKAPFEYAIYYDNKTSYFNLSAFIWLDLKLRATEGQEKGCYLLSLDDELINYGLLMESKNAEWYLIINQIIMATTMICAMALSRQTIMRYFSNGKKELEAGKTVRVGYNPETGLYSGESYDH